MIGMVATGSRKLAGQIAVSVVAATCAAIAVPPLLSAIGHGARTPEVVARLPHVAPPVDFDAAFVWPVATPPGVPGNLVRPAVPTPSAAPAAAPLPAARPALAAARGCAPRCTPPRQPVTPVQDAPGAPLELAAMIAPPVAAAPRRTLLGIPVPKLPYEDRVVDTLARAGGAVRNLF